MPPKSESQRRAMFAAASGKSTLGIPKSVGKEFADADPGGKLPTRAPEGLSAKIAKQKAARTPKK
jgi:hypothetical protein